MEILKTGMIYCTAEIRGVEDRTVDLAFSSEEPVERSFGTYSQGCGDDFLLCAMLNQSIDL